jgi:methanethiol oxidase
MPLLKPDPTFYPSPRLAMQAPPEKHAFVAALNPPGSKLNDALLVVDVDPESATYGQRVGEVKMPKFGDELHHFGWNACSSALCPYAPHPHVERRYLVVPGIRSSRIHIIDTKPDPRKPQIVKVIEPEEVFARANYSRPHTIHCGPEAIYVSALGRPRSVGSRPRRAVFALRFLVAPRVRHAAQQRMGHSEHDRERSSTRSFVRR